MYIDERQRAQHRNVCASQERVSVVRCHRGAEQDERSGEKGRRSQSREEEGEESGLDYMSAHVLPSYYIYRVGSIPTYHNSRIDALLYLARRGLLLVTQLLLLDLRCARTAGWRQAHSYKSYL